MKVTREGSTQAVRILADTITGEERFLWVGSFYATWKEVRGVGSVDLPKGLGAHEHGGEKNGPPKSRKREGQRAFR